MGLDHCLHHSCVSGSPLCLPNVVRTIKTHCRLTELCLSIIGGALMSFLPTSNRVGILAGIYLVNAVVAPLAIFYNVSHVHSFSRRNTESQTDHIMTVDGRQLCWSNEACLCRRSGIRILLHRQHHRAPNVPGPRRPRLPARQDGRLGDASRLRWYHLAIVLLLRLGQQAARRPQQRN